VPVTDDVTEDGNPRGVIQLGIAEDGAKVHSKPFDSVAIFGCVDSGKTRGFLAPAITNWRGPVIVVSTDDELFKLTSTTRTAASESDPLVIDLEGRLGSPRNDWNLLSAVTDWESARRVSKFFHYSERARLGTSDLEFWERMAQQLLAFHIFAAAKTNYSVQDVGKWLASQEEFEVRELLKVAGDDDAMSAANASWQREERSRSSIYTTAEGLFDGFDSSAGNLSITKGSLDTSASTTFVVVPHDSPRSVSVANAFLNALYEHRKLLVADIQPLLIVFDDTRYTNTLLHLAHEIKQLAKHETAFITTWQSIDEVQQNMGTESIGLLRAHRINLFMKGLIDDASLGQLERMAGIELEPSTLKDFGRLEPGSGLMFRNGRSPQWIQAFTTKAQ
jgi:hypothetical protein